MCPLIRAAFAVALVMSLRPARAETLTIDLPTALDRAHRLTRAAVQARAPIATAEAEIAGADVAFATNPDIDVGAGPRFSATRPLEADVRVTQMLELGRREPRRALARTQVEHARASADASLRDLDLEVAVAFYRALYAHRVVELATRSEEIAARAADAAERRRRAGDVTDLDAGLVRAAAGRARAATQAATAERTTALGRLAVLVGAGPEDTLALSGDLNAAPQTPQPLDRRADLRALDRERAVGEAEHDVADANARPDLGIWIGYMREDRDDILIAGLRVDLPVWNRGQGDKARATAHVAMAQAELAAATRAATREVADAREAERHAREAVETYERDVLPILDDSERLLDKSIDAGQLAIAEYLVARQELIAGRREYLDRLLALAETTAQVAFVEGARP